VTYNQLRQYQEIECIGTEAKVTRQGGMGDNTAAPTGHGGKRRWRSGNGPTGAKEGSERETEIRVVLRGG